MHRCTSTHPHTLYKKSDFFVVRCAQISKCPPPKTKTKDYYLTNIYEPGSGPSPKPNTMNIAQARGGGTPNRMCLWQGSVSVALAHGKKYWVDGNDIFFCGSPIRQQKINAEIARITKTLLKRPQ
eukprot:GEMP01131795.1.p1 GENE.GEMP01131795.1~~GEMP01131795.1.p1  ORF type:complete len:125 (+),score=4.99 GEMP01131795.1:116-490(+)